MYTGSEFISVAAHSQMAPTIHVRFAAVTVSDTSGRMVAMKAMRITRCEDSTHQRYGNPEELTLINGSTSIT